MTTTTILSVLIAATTACGPKKPPDSAEHEPAGEPETAESGDTGAAAETTEAAEAVPVDGPVLFDGVQYTVGAEPIETPQGWGVDVTVDVQIADGEAHMFVHDSDWPSELMKSILFVHDIGDLAGNSLSMGFESSTGKNNTEVHKPAEPFTMKRTYPESDSSTMKWVGPGQILDLRVVIWGTESPSHPLMQAPEIAVVTMTVSNAGEPEISIEHLDPELSRIEDGYVKEVDSFTITVKPFSPLEEFANTQSEQDVTLITVRETLVRLKADEIVVNDLYYGKLAEGAQVVVDGGEITVDGEVREGEKIVNAKMIEFFLKQVCELTLGGYKVSAAPCEGYPGTHKDGKTYAFNLGEYKAVIEKGKLTVDGIAYGKVAKKAEISIWFGEVKVDGKERLPADETKGK